MKSIAHILQSYKNWLMAVLAPLGGPWAVFIIGLMDAAAFGIPLDPIVAYYVHIDPRRTMVYVLMGAVGSALGSSVPYLLGYKGGEAFVVKKVGRQRFERIHAFTEKYGDLALIVPGVMPPGTPYKLFVFSAGVAEMNYLHFLLAVFTGRVLRFSVLAALTIKFGPQILELIGVLVKRHLAVTLIAIAVLVALAVFGARQRRKSDEETTAEAAEESEVS